MKCGLVTTFQVLTAIMDAVDLLLGHVVRDFHVKIPSCLMPRAKENRMLEQGNLTVERNKSMNEWS